MLKSGDHLVSKENVYIVMPHLNGHRKVRLFCRNKEAYVDGAFSFMDCTDVKEIAKIIGEDKLFHIKSENVRFTHNWSEKIKQVRKGV